MAIFRQNLFRPSEPFITQQARLLRRHAPFYVGRLRFGDAPAGATSVALQDRGLPGAWPLIGWQMLTRDPAPYLRLIGDRRPALIHAHFGIDGVYALPIAQRLHVPLVTTFHGYDATLSTAALLTSPAWANYPLFRRRLAARGDLFLCVSHFIRDRVLAMGFPAERTLLHYTGVDCRAFPLRDPAEATPVILHVARLVEMKGTRYLIEAFAGLAARHPELRLVIVGDGPLRPALTAMSVRLGLADRISFLGARPHAEIAGWMRRAMMLVLPSINTGTGRVEGLGMVLLEAAATGVPVVATDVGGIPEGAEDGVTGILTPERDPAALFRAMLALAGDAAMRARMGQAGRNLVERRFDIVRQNHALELHYDRVRLARTS
ncbi:glycosyltransferase [Lichenicoccus roseus]|uniref:Glycosyltransferase n=1 Tax=Lichenicoccus roseus TaxID=2683649 RepID=A0A5R9J7Z3_9PROT|nr:glycosyltransferase [Lichenicoccus roseus]